MMPSSKPGSVAGRYDWVLDLDIKSFFDEIDWDLLMRAVRRHTDCPWVLLYLERWLRAPVSMPDGDLVDREKRDAARGCCQSRAGEPLSFTMRSISGCNGNIRTSRSNATLMTRSAIARAKRRRLSYVRRWKRGLRSVGYGCTRKRPRSSTAKMPIVPGNTRSDHSTFSATRLGRDRRSADDRKRFVSFIPAVSDKAAKRIRLEVRQWRLHLRSDLELDEIAGWARPFLSGWVRYYGRFYPSKLREELRTIDAFIVRWVSRKYKRFRGHTLAAWDWLRSLKRRNPDLFAHWALGPAAG